LEKGLSRVRDDDVDHSRGDAFEGLVVSFDPGLVRIGRLTSRSAGTLEVEFPRRQTQTLAVGANVMIGFAGVRHSDPATLPVDASPANPAQAALTVERLERGDARRYRLTLHDAAPAADATLSADRIEPPGRPFRVDLRFGQLEFKAGIAAWTAKSIQLQVSIETEATLRATDAIELVHRSAGNEAEIRLTGWIDRRVLSGGSVRYEFRIDDHLSEDCVRQRGRLRTLLSSDGGADKSLQG